MAGRIHVLWVVVMALAMAAAGIVAGFELGRGSTTLGAPGPGSGSPVLSITAAGTLGTAFGSIASLLANESPGVQAPLSAQQYQGSLAALGQISIAHQSYDVAAAADFRLIPRSLYPAYADWEVVFATNPEVLVYDPSFGGFAGINTTNWAERLQGPDIILGVANASTDPNGYNGIFVLELEGLLESGSLAAVYGHFFQGAVGGFAVPIPNAARVEPETQVATLIENHVVQAYITYRSYAITHHLSFVSLDPRVDLGEFGGDYLSEYARASTAILGSSGGGIEVRGAPVAFAVTVPSNAPNASLGGLFVHLVVSPQGASVLASFGFTPLTPALSYGPGRLPGLIVPLTTPLPLSLVSEIPG